MREAKRPAGRGGAVGPHPGIVTTSWAARTPTPIILGQLPEGVGGFSKGGPGCCRPGWRPEWAAGGGRGGLSVWLLALGRALKCAQGKKKKKHPKGLNDFVALRRRLSWRKAALYFAKMPRGLVYLFSPLFLRIGGGAGREKGPSACVAQMVPQSLRGQNNGNGMVL